MTILVTGGQGLLGKAIQDVLAKAKASNLLLEGDENFVFLSRADGDLRSYEEMHRIFAANSPVTAVIHLGARVGGLYANMNDQLGFFRDNMEMNLTITKLCDEFKVKKAIFCLSTCVFPSEAINPLKEEYLHNGPPHQSNEGYAYSKRGLECLCRYYREKHSDYDWICVVPTNLYGPHDQYDLNDSHVIPGLIHKMYLAKLNDEKLTIMGTGKALRQFLFSQDAAKFILQILKKTQQKYSSVMLCPDENQFNSISSIIDMMKEIMEFKNEIVYDTTKSDGIFKKNSSNERLKEILGDEDLAKDLVDIHEGLKISIQWFINNYPQNVRK